MADTARIHSLVAKARRRLRLQSALDAVVLALIPAAAAAAAGVYLVRADVLEPEGGLAILAGAALLLAVAGVLGALRRFPTPLVATRIDRASGLSDRLASACEFEESLARDFDGPDETRLLMEAAIADAVAASERAQVAAATPFRWPRDTRAALAFVTAAVAVSGLYVVPPVTDPSVARVDPPAAARGAEVELTGVRFGGAGEVVFGEGAAARPAAILAWDDTRIRVTVPSGVKVGATTVEVHAEAGSSAPRRFDVLRDGARRRDPNEPVALADEDLGYTRDLLEELRRTAEAGKDLELQALSKKIDDLLQQAERGDISREDLLEQMTKAHDEYMKGASEKMTKEALADLKKTGEELARSELTRELGKALDQGDLDKARQEMEKLAEKLAKGEVSDKQAAEAAKAMEKAAKAFEKRQEARERLAEQKVDKAKKELQEAETKGIGKFDAKTKEERGRRIEQKKRELAKAERERDEQRDSEQKRSLKRLHRNMEQASQQMRQKNQESRRQASRQMEDMARETGKVDADKRKITQQKKVASQLEDLKEAMRRARQGGTRGPQDRFGRNKRNADFARRAAGRRGQKGAWKPGQGQPGGKGQPGGQGQQPGGDSYGDGHDPDLLGDATKRSGKTSDESVSGVHGKGPSTRETILSAAQKGFASRQYREVYVRYKTALEEVINAEKVPSGYKYYVKKYFQKIRPPE